MLKMPLPSTAQSKELLSYGKLPPLTTSLGELEWGVSPTLLWELFRSWREWWVASWMGPANDGQLVSIIMIRLSAEWHNTLQGTFWDNTTIEGLYIDTICKLELVHPPLKGAITILSNLQKSSSETYTQYFEHVKQSLNKLTKHPLQDC